MIWRHFCICTQCQSMRQSSLYIRMIFCQTDSLFFVLIIGPDSINSLELPLRLVISISSRGLIFIVFWKFFYSRAIGSLTYSRHEHLYQVFILVSLLALSIAGILILQPLYCVSSPFVPSWSLFIKLLALLFYISLYLVSCFSSFESVICYDL